MMRVGIALIIFSIMGTIFTGVAYSGETLKPGSRYKIIRPLYLMAVYDSLNNRQLSRETARAYLHSEQYANKSFVAFQCEVPAGTVMTIINPIPKVWHLPFFAKRYLIKLDPDLSRGLDVVLELNRELEGNLDGLNPEIFSRSD